ncbi:transcription factor IIIA-like [Aulostomus maculatus]
MEENPPPHKRFICSFPGCSAAYNKQWKLDAHLCKHTGVKPHACELDGCGKSFCSRYHLARHQLTHGGQQPFPCTVDGCSQAFTTNSNRARHVTRVHDQDQKMYECKYEGCGLRFKKNKQLKSHVCEQHTQLPAFPCTHQGCQMQFTCPSKLKRHEKVHRGYPCKGEGCTFTGKTWTEFLKHKREQHRPSWGCDQCGKAFRDSWFLHQHQRVHSETRRVYRCPRNGCQRSFTTTFNLQSHINSFHEELRPFTCPQTGCGKTFAMKQSLHRHSVVHDPERRKQKRPRPKRSLASKLSGFSKKKRAGQKAEGQPGSVELVSLLQDATLVCGGAVNSHGLGLTAPVTA